ncbi:MbnP family copper-binding protein [Terricaulis sp.]|uniref:MbnP family copper-binding protein n=1 Tax=Terricaulis sp. TaxID=2768686 RepID=UPI002AC68AD8|nr:MbnP family copper-binding protein [Terricaulis sp.]MDZ4689682.1 metallo-mystery pair system four-Cys motif protein [Terricaulis sp.]
MKKHLAALAALCLTSACASAALPPAAPMQGIAIRFDARAGDQGLRCGQSYSGIGSTGASVTLQDFRIYVSNFRLIDRDGREQALELTPDGAFQGASVALLDFENATGNCNGNSATNSIVRGRAPAGDYVGLTFDIGVPVDLNHQDTTLAAPPLNFSALTWAWRYGYKFTTIDLETGRAPDAAPSEHGASGFSIHLGSVDCGAGSPRTPPESPCTTPNRPSYRLDAFDPARQVVVLDLAALLAATDVTINDPESASGCMSTADDDDCVAIMDRFGLPFRGQASHGQRFVRAADAN